MKKHEFFAKYANTPLSLRFVPIDFNKGGNMTLSNVNDEMKRLEDQMRPMKIREDELLKLASSILERKKL